MDDEGVFPAEEQPMPAADSPTYQSPGYIPESDPKEDPEEDDEEDPEEDPADYPLTQDPYPCFIAHARISTGPHARTVLTKEVAERLLALPTQPPSPLSLYSSPLPQIPSPLLPIPSPPPNGPTYVKVSSGHPELLIRQRELHYHPYARLLEELGYGIQIHGIDLIILDPLGTIDECLRQTHSEGISLGLRIMAQHSEITELQAADRSKKETDGDYRSTECRLSIQRQLVRHKESEEPQDSDDRAQR
ncbi:hypothetical protein Tco_0210890 [Tanacetum coccineum]